MPEHRGRKHHQDRVAETLREEIGVLIEGELVDPRINLCYVTEVALNPGGKSARVYVAIDSAVKDIAKAEEETVAGLEAAKGYIRYELKERMGVRHVPELSFLADRSGRFQARIEELMDRQRKRQKAPAADEPGRAESGGGAKGYRWSSPSMDHSSRSHGLPSEERRIRRRSRRSAAGLAPAVSAGRPDRSDSRCFAPGRAVPGLFARAAGRRCGGLDAGHGNAAGAVGQARRPGDGGPDSEDPSRAAGGGRDSHRAARPRPL